MPNLKQTWKEASFEKKLGLATVAVAVLGSVVVPIVLFVIDGNGNGSSRDRDTVPLATWVRDASDICARTNEDVDDLPPPEAIDVARVGVDGLLQWGRPALGLARRELRELRALKPPDDRADEVERFLRLRALTNQAMEELFASLRATRLGRGDVFGAFQQIDSVSKAAQDADEAATRLGATACAEGASFLALQRMLPDGGQR